MGAPRGTNRLVLADGLGACREGATCARLRRRAGLTYYNGQ